MTGQSLTMVASANPRPEPAPGAVVETGDAEGEGHVIEPGQIAAGDEQELKYNHQNPPYQPETTGTEQGQDATISTR